MNKALLLLLVTLLHFSAQAQKPDSVAKVYSKYLFQVEATNGETFMACKVAGLNGLLMPLHGFMVNDQAPGKNFENYIIRRVKSWDVTVRRFFPAALKDSIFKVTSIDIPRDVAFVAMDLSLMGFGRDSGFVIDSFKAFNAGDKNNAYLLGPMRDTVGMDYKSFGTGGANEWQTLASRYPSHHELFYATPEPRTPMLQLIDAFPIKNPLVSGSLICRLKKPSGIVALLHKGYKGRPLQVAVLLGGLNLQNYDAVVADGSLDNCQTRFRQVRNKFGKPETFTTATAKAGDCPTAYKDFLVKRADIKKLALKEFVPNVIRAYKDRRCSGNKDPLWQHYCVAFNQNEVNVGFDPDTTKSEFGIAFKQNYPLTFALLRARVLQDRVANASPMRNGEDVKRFRQAMDSLQTAWYAVHTLSAPEVELWKKEGMNLYEEMRLFLLVRTGWQSIAGIADSVSLSLFPPVAITQVLNFDTVSREVFTLFDSLRAAFITAPDSIFIVELLQGDSCAKYQRNSEAVRHYMNAIRAMPTYYEPFNRIWLLQKSGGFDDNALDILYANRTELMQLATLGAYHYLQLQGFQTPKLAADFRRSDGNDLLPTLTYGNAARTGSDVLYGVYAPGTYDGPVAEATIRHLQMTVLRWRCLFNSWFDDGALQFSFEAGADNIPYRKPFVFRATDFWNNDPSETQIAQRDGKPAASISSLISGKEDQKSLALGYLRTAYISAQLARRFSALKEVSPQFNITNQPNSTVGYTKVELKVRFSE